jgi:hypothetical protein
MEGKHVEGFEEEKDEGEPGEVFTIHEGIHTKQGMTWHSEALVTQNGIHTKAQFVGEVEVGYGREEEQLVVKANCHAFVVAKTVQELRDLGRDMLRIHAENHGVEHAGKLRTRELVREMVHHYNSVHNAGLVVSQLDQLKLNMLPLKKVKVDIKEKTPPPDTTNMVPKNVVPYEEQVRNVYEKRADICAAGIIVNNLKDMLALGNSSLRPEASRHRVCNASRKQKLQVVEELWEHYLQFHLQQAGDEGPGPLKLGNQELGSRALLRPPGPSWFPSVVQTPEASTWA